MKKLTSLILSLAMILKVLILNNKKKSCDFKITGFLVGVTGLEPTASCSQSRRATNCATPR